MVNLLPHAQLFPVWQLAVWLQACSQSVCVFVLQVASRCQAQCTRAVVVTLDTKQAVKICPETGCNSGATNSK